MSKLGKLKTNSAIANETDSLGAGNVLDSGLYNCTIDLAYISESRGGAIGLNLHLNTEGANKSLLRQIIYVTSGNAKGNKTTYTDKNGVDHYSPGFNMGNAISLLTTGKELSELDDEDKVVKLWDYDAKAEIPKTVSILPELLGTKITLGILKQIVDKRVQNAAGKYVNTGDTREENGIDKAFHADSGLTVAEVRAEATEPAFQSSWASKWTGKVKNKSTGAPGGSKAGSPTKPATSIFNKKT